MRVYLIAAPEDEAHAEKLAAHLKQFGVSIRAEYGGFGYPPAHHGEFTLALWSRAALMSVRRIQLTNRAIDAWSEGQLVMARLEPGIGPQGLADLDMVDLTFEAAREHRYRDVLNALRALENAARSQMRSAAQMPEPVAAAPPSIGDDSGAGPDDLPSQSMNAASSAPGGKGFVLFLLFAIAIVAGLGWAVWSQVLTWQQGAMMGAGALVGLILLGAVASTAKGRKYASKKPKPVQRKRAATSDVSGVSERMVVPAPVADVSSDTHDVFVSYSHHNAETVLPIIETVEEGGLSIWIDRDELRAGQNWAGQIVRAIKASGRFCLMCSEQAFASDHVRREVYLADKYGKDMVPVRLDGSDMPEDIEYFLIGRQWIDLTALPEQDRVSAIRTALSTETA